MTTETVQLACDMTKDCKEAITHLDEKGYIYCAQHGKNRQVSGWGHCRKLRPHELNRLKKGLQITRY